MDAETHAQILALERMTPARLQQRYAEVFGEPTLVKYKAWQLKRITWRLQALAEGDLSQRARQRAAELANEADLRLSPPRQKLSPTTPRVAPRIAGGVIPDRTQRFAPAAAG